MDTIEIIQKAKALGLGTWSREGDPDNPWELMEIHTGLLICWARGERVILDAYDLLILKLRAADGKVTLLD